MTTAVTESENMLLIAPIAAPDQASVFERTTEPRVRLVGKLPDLVDMNRESRTARHVYALLAILVSLAFFVHSLAYWTPANPGVDQNGYLVGGKQFSQTLSMRFAPVRPGTESTFDPYQYVSAMWIGTNENTPAEAFYPKYPLGYPFLIAIALWCSPASWGTFVAYLINPVSMTIACLALFFLARKFMHSLAALLAMIAFISSPVAQGLTSSPNSHATATCCVVVGMWALIDWWQKRGAWRAILAGLLLGYAGTIRYTEGALIFPIAFVALINFRFREWKSWRETMWLIGSWTLPIATLLVINLATMGTRTGYDPTHESGGGAGFRLEYAHDNWETLLRQLNTFGLSYLFPIALAGIVWMFWWNWRVACWLAAWMLPCLATYLFYYWAPNPGPNPQIPVQFDVVWISYTRFFLTILPGLSLAAFWMLDRAITLADRHWPTPSDAWRARVVVSVFVASLIASIVVVHVFDSDQPTFVTHGSIHVGGKASVILNLLASASAALSTNGSSLLALLATATALAALTTSLVATPIFGRASLARIGVGALAALVIGMQMDVSLVAWEAAQIQQKNLQLSTEEIQTAAPSGSVLFATDTALLNHVQFADDYTLYQGQAFQQPFIQSLATAKDDPADPQALDTHRKMALYERLHSFDQHKLDEEERSIIEAAIDANRRVFVLIPRRDGPNVRKRSLVKPTRKVFDLRAPLPTNVGLPDPFNRVLTNDKFQTDVVATWTQIKPRFDDAGAFRPRGLRIGPPLDRSISWYQLLEITRKAPPPPAPKPVPPIPVATKPIAPQPAATKPAASTSTATKPTAVAPPPTPASLPTTLPHLTTAPATTQTAR